MPLPADDPTQRKPDTSLAQAKLGGWAPTVELEEGLKRTIAYFAERLGLEPRRTKNANRSEAARLESRSAMEASHLTR